MADFDTTSPGFVVEVISPNPEPRIRGRTEKQTGTLGQKLDDGDWTDRVISFVFEDAEKEQDVLRLKVDNSDLYFFDHPAWVKGNKVRFLFGYPGRIFQPRIHVIDSVRGDLTLDIVCVEQSALSNEVKCRIFKNKTRADVVKEIVAEGSFQDVKEVQIEEEAFASEGKRDWQQSRQTDMAFLKRLAEKVGMEVFIEGVTLFFVRRRLSTRPRRRFEYFFGLGDLIDFKIREWRTTDRPAETEVKGRDPIARQTVAETGSNENTDRPTLGNQGTFFLRAGGDGGLIAGKQVITTPETSKATVKQEADTHYRRQEEGEIEMTATIIGDPQLRAKEVIEIRGLSNQLSGNYYITKHVHEITRGGGYKGKLELIKNALTNIPVADQPTLDGSKANENDQQAVESRVITLVPDEDTGGLVGRQ